MQPSHTLLLKVLTVLKSIADLSSLLAMSLNSSGALQLRRLRAKLYGLRKLLQCILKKCSVMPSRDQGCWHWRPLVMLCIDQSPGLDLLLDYFDHVTKIFKIPCTSSSQIIPLMAVRLMEGTFQTGLAL